MAIVRLSNSSSNPQKTITAGDQKKEKPKGEKKKNQYLS